jgi:hypothetical protein
MSMDLYTSILHMKDEMGKEKSVSFVMNTNSLKVQSSKMDPAKISLIQQIVIKREERRFKKKSAFPLFCESPSKITVPSPTVIGN